jgi:hypothetical protein
MPRKISFLNVLYIYFNIAPYILGELSLIFGFSALASDNLENGIIAWGIVLASIGLFFTIKKFKVLRRAITTIKYGAKTTAKLSWILDSAYQHNHRVVKTYIFNYYVDKKMYSYDFNSAYRRNLKTRDQMNIYYLQSNPKYSFIPELYFVEIE